METIPITLQQALTYITDLGKEHGADCSTSIALQDEGAILTVFWTGDRDGDLPREVWLYFGQKGNDFDTFLWAFAVDPRRFMWATDEGLNDEQVNDYSQIMIERLEDVVNFLLDKPYRRITNKDLDLTNVKM